MSTFVWDLVLVGKKHGYLKFLFELMSPNPPNNKLCYTSPSLSKRLIINRWHLLCHLKRIILFQVKFSVGCCCGVARKENWGLQNGQLLSNYDVTMGIKHISSISFHSVEFLVVIQRLLIIFVRGPLSVKTNPKMNCPGPLGCKPNKKLRNENLQTCKSSLMSPSYVITE